MKTIKANPFKAALLGLLGLLTLLLALIVWKLFTINYQLDEGIGVYINGTPIDVRIEKNSSQY